jgi:hypothetical protein
MSRHECSRSWEIDAIQEGRLGAADVASFERHVRSCPYCSAAATRTEQRRRLGEELIAEGPSELTLRRLRHRILRGLAVAPLPRRRAAAWLAIASLAIACLAAWVAATRRPVVDAAPSAPSRSASSVQSAQTGPSFAGSVHPWPATRWEQTRLAGIERVTLEEGAIAANVRPQQSGERFIVELPDGELEVRGTTFEVMVVEGRTRRVHVDEGLVELRLRAYGTVMLGRDETWQEPTVAAEPSPPRVAAAPPVRDSSAPGKPIATPTVNEEANLYANAMNLLRARENDEAAAAFHAFAAAHPRATQAEDASFLEAVALARAGRADAAGLAAERHLTAFPRSFHRKEAAILVGRAARLRGDCAAARAALAPWLEGAADADALAALRGCDVGR